MNDAISRKALLDWLDVEISLSSGNDPVLKADRWAFRQVKKAIETGTFDFPEPKRPWEALRDQVQRWLATTTEDPNGWDENGWDIREIQAHARAWRHVLYAMDDLEVIQPTAAQPNRIDAARAKIAKARFSPERLAGESAVYGIDCPSGRCEG